MSASPPGTEILSVIHAVNEHTGRDAERDGARRRGSPTMSASGPVDFDSEDHDGPTVRDDDSPVQEDLQDLVDSVEEAG
jgi:hypothetical protein